MVERERLRFGTWQEWDAWLAEHHDDPAYEVGVGLEIAKKGAATETVKVVDALDVALCWGWIDAIRNTIDDQFFLQAYTPRRRTSTWSQVNQGKVATLIGEGRMRPPGQAEIDRAKADGRWAVAYAPQSANEMPDDVAAALATASDTARVNWAAAPKASRFIYIANTIKAKRPETRTRRITALIEKLERGEAI